MSDASAGKAPAPAAVTYPLGTMAKVLLLTERSVNHLAATGIIPKAERGRYELIPCVHAYIRYLRDRGGINGDAGGRSDDATSPKGRIISARAKLVETEAAMMTREAFKARNVVAAWVGILDGVRTRMRAIPAACAPLWASAINAAEAQAAIARAINDVLDELSRSPVYTDSDTDQGTAGAGAGGEDGAGSAGSAAGADSIGVG